MALSDLAVELDRERFAFSSVTTERDVWRHVTRMLGDTSSDVSGLAIKCVQQLAARCSDEGVRGVTQALCTLLLTAKEEQTRDAAALAAKAAVAGVTPAHAATLAATAAEPLLKGLKSEVGVCCGGRERLAAPAEREAEKGRGRGRRVVVTVGEGDQGRELDV